MNCKRCGASLLLNKNCSQCGLNDAFVKKCIHTSNNYYNRGLDKAQIRDLSGAIIELKKAVKYNKMNIDAHNLLGLCYYEMGEVVYALREWVVSQNFKKEDNLASSYIGQVQASPKKIDEVNATIRKYNQTLSYMKQGDYDLAYIQLKRLIGITPNYVNALLLLSLLYMQMEQPEKAKKVLRKVFRIDRNNTLASKYYKELTGVLPFSPKEPKKTKKAATAPIAQNEREPKIKQKEIEPGKRMSIDQYVESSNNKYTFCGILVGFVVAIAFMWFLLIPHYSQTLAQKYNDKKQEYIEELAAKNKDISKLEDDIAECKEKNENLTKELAKAVGDSSEGNVYDNLMNAAKFKNLNDNEQAAEYLLKIKNPQKDLEFNSSKALYKQLSDSIFPIMCQTAYNEGYRCFSIGDYKNAISKLKQAYEYDDTKVDALYYVGRSYQFSKQYDKAKKIYEEVIDKFPDNRRALQAKTNMDEMENEKQQ